MSKCECGQELSQTSLRCAYCGRKFTIDSHQSGNIEQSREVDWDSEFKKLESGQLRPARAEIVPRRRGFWSRLFKR